jgi:hypothetical protein
VNKIELIYKVKAAIDRGDYYLLSKADAMAFIADCRDEGFPILGIDVFYEIDEESIQPSVENSIDFSATGFKLAKDFYSYAMECLSKLDEDLFFEIVC